MNEIDKLIAAEFDKVWKKEIVQKYKNAHPNQTAPRGYVLGGQSGAGKSSLTKIIFVDLSGNIVEINGDNFRKYHPEYANLQSKYGKDAPKYTAEFAGKMTEMIFQRAMQERYNIVIEGTFRTAKTPIKTLKILKENGYDTNVFIKATPKNQSWENCTQRYESMYELDPKEARYTDKSHHDLIVEKISTNIQEVFDSNLVNTLKIYTQNEIIFDSKKDNKNKISTVFEAILDNKL